MHKSVNNKNQCNQIKSKNSLTPYSLYSDPFSGRYQMRLRQTGAWVKNSSETINK